MTYLVSCCKDVVYVWKLVVFQMMGNRRDFKEWIVKKYHKLPILPQDRKKWNRREEDRDQHSIGSKLYRDSLETLECRVFRSTTSLRSEGCAVGSEPRKKGSELCRTERKDNDNTEEQHHGS
jgi:hypothetical protein